MILKKINSFKIDHEKLEKGLYVSSVYKYNECILTTFDLRMKKPNNNDYLSNESIHTLEHLIASILRSNIEYENRIIYFGPMGCRTGFYLIIKSEEDIDSFTIKSLLTFTFETIINYEDNIPGVDNSSCGNYLEHNLISAKNEALAYLNDVLNQLNETNTKYAK